MLMNLATCQWHEPYLPLFNMTAAALPKIVSNAEVYGYVDEGMLAGAPISGCLGDQMAAMLGKWQAHIAMVKTVRQCVIFEE
jgi:glycerol kinase